MEVDNIWLGLLGEPIITRDARQIDLPAAKAVALLAFLALSDAPPSRDQVITLLWPERDITVGRKDLRNTLWQLRQALGAGIVARGDRLGLAAQVRVDAHDLAATGDLARYRGAVLATLVVRAAPDFELWLDRERERWLACYLEKLTSAITAARSQADWRHLEQLTRTGLQHAPYDETLHQALMEALARQGHRDEALRHYAGLHTLLAHDLALTPLATTIVLADRIMAGEFAPDLPTYPLSHLPSPYDPVAVASQQLGLGWQLAGQGAVEAAAQHFMEAGMALAVVDDWYGATLAHAEMAALALAVASYPALRAAAERAQCALGESIAPALQRLVQFLVGMGAFVDDGGAAGDALKSGKQLVLDLLQAARLEYGYRMLRQQGIAMPTRASQTACILMASLGAHPLRNESTPASLSRGANL